MARISRSRNFKFITGILMTLVLVISLFAGLGVIWVNEDVHVASADTDMIADGKYVVPGGTAGSVADSTKGTDANPFTVLEIVPNHNMAQFGYLVGGQEPIDLFRLTLNSADYETYHEKLAEYMDIERLDPDKAANVFNEYVKEGETYTVFDGSTETTLPYGDGKLLWEVNKGAATQYGQYEKNDEGETALISIKTETKLGYAVYKQKPEDTEDDIPKRYTKAALETGEFEKKEDAINSVIGSLSTSEYVKDPTKDEILVKVPAGTGVLSTAWYKYVGLYNGLFSLTHMLATDGHGDRTVVDPTEVVYKTNNSITYDPTYGRYNAKSGSSNGFTTADNYVVFRLKANDGSDDRRPTYNAVGTGLNGNIRPDSYTFKYDVTNVHEVTSSDKYDYVVAEGFNYVQVPKAEYTAITDSSFKKDELVYTEDFNEYTNYPAANGEKNRTLNPEEITKAQYDAISVESEREKTENSITKNAYDQRLANKGADYVRKVDAVTNDEPRTLQQWRNRGSNRNYYSTQYGTIISQSDYNKLRNDERSIKTETFDEVGEADSLIALLKSSNMSKIKFEGVGNSNYYSSYVKGITRAQYDELSRYEDATNLYLVYSENGEYYMRKVRATVYYQNLFFEKVTTGPFYYEIKYQNYLYQLHKYYVKRYSTQKYYTCDYVFSGSSTGDACVVFTYDKNGNGKYVVDKNKTGTITSQTAYLSYYEDLANTKIVEPKDFIWKPDTNGRYVEVAADTHAPQEVGSYQRTFGTHETVKLGEYDKTELGIAGIDIIEEKTEGGNRTVIAEKDYDKYYIIPVYSDAVTYEYRLRNYNTVKTQIDNDEKYDLVARYKWVGEKYARKVDSLTEEFINEHTLPEYMNYNAEPVLSKFTEGSGEEIPRILKFYYVEDWSTYEAKPRTYSSAYYSSFTSNELFKKKSIGLAYKDNDYTKDEDVDQYKFAGWYTDQYGNELFSNGTKIKSDTRIYAKWIQRYPDDTTKNWQGYSVTYVANDSTDDVAENMPGDTINHRITGFSHDALITEPASIPVRKNYIFDGWYTKPDNSGSKFNFTSTRLNASIMDTTTNEGGETVSTDNLTLYAHWTPISATPAVYNYRFNLNTVTLPTGVVIKSGAGDDAPAYGEKTVTAVAVNGKRYYTEDGVEYKGVSVEIGDYTPYASGYTFAGWYMEATCRNQFTFDTASINKLMTLYPLESGRDTFVLYARWIDSNSTPRYNVTFDLNKPSTAVATPTLSGSGIILNAARAYVMTDIEYGTEIPNLSDLEPVLTGNVEAKLGDYKVKVVTVTPDDLNDTGSEAFKLIKRADLIVLNETCDPLMSELWEKYKKYSSLTAKEVEGEKITSFSDNDLGWAATMAIFSRITGLEYDDTKKKNIDVETCPVLFDYNIFYNCFYSPDTKIAKEVSFTVEDKNGDDISISDEPSCSANVYKLYLMTQVSSPVTIYNAFFTKTYDEIHGVYTERFPKKVIQTTYEGRTTGRITTTDDDEFSFTSDDNGDVFWNQFTLVPYNVISASDWSEAKRDNTLSLLSFKKNIFMDPIDGTSSVQNRMFIYNNRKDGTSNSVNLISGYNEKIAMDSASSSSLNTMLSDPKDGDKYSTGDIFYYMIHGTTMYDNFDRDLRVLEIQPGTGGHPDEYWFWYISHYVPNVSGTITGNAMSSLEFQCNIEDLNSAYDVIYMGTDKTRYDLSGNPDNSSLAKIEPTTVYSYTEDLPAFEGNISGALLTELKNKINGSSNSNNKANPYTLLPTSYTTGGKTYTRNNGVTPFDQGTNTGMYWPSSGTTNIKIVDNTLDTYSYKYNANYLYIRKCTQESYYTWFGLVYHAPVYTYLRVPYYAPKPTTISATTQYTYYHTGLIGNTSQYAIGTFNSLKVNDDGTVEPKENISPITFNIYDNNVLLLRSYIDGACAANKAPRDCLPGSIKIDETTYIREGSYDSTKTEYEAAPVTIVTSSVDRQYQYKRDNNYVYIKHNDFYTYGERDRSDYSKYRYYYQDAIGSNDDVTTKAAYSGNDFTFAKYKAVAEFLKAKYPIIFDDGFFTAGGAVNTGLIDTSSWIYKLLNELVTESPNREHYNWFRENTTDAIGTAQFLDALTNKTFTLVVENKPVEYRDRTLSIFDGITDPAEVDKLIYINGGAGNSNNRDLKFDIKINEVKAGGKYNLKLFIDTNGDGKYNTETERIDTITVYDTKENRSFNADTTSLVAGRTYKVSRTLPADQTGVIAWKLQIVSLKDGVETKIRDDVTGLSAIKVATRTKINILQITSTASDETFRFTYKSKGHTGDDDKEMTGKRGTTSIYLPTDPEIDASALSVPAGQPDDAYMYTNWSEFRKYTKDLDEFEIHFYRINTEELAQIAAGEKADVGICYEVEPSGSTYRFKKVGGNPVATTVTWSDIGMLVIGFGFGYNDITDPASRELIQDFIECGKTVLFTNDTIKDEFMSNRYTFDLAYNHEYYHNSVTEHKGSRLSSSYSGYYLTQTFRNMLGQDRFGAQVNYGFFNDSAKIKNEVNGDSLSGSSVKSIRKQVADDLGVSQDNLQTTLNGIKIGNASGYKLKYDIPFITGDNMDLTDISHLANIYKERITGTQNFNYTYVSGYDWWGDPVYSTASAKEFKHETSDDQRVLVQGLSKNALKTGAFTPVYEATKTNEGQIVSYPYSIGKLAGDGKTTIIDTALTRAQYMQLNMEDDDIVVWFSLYKQGVTDGDVSGSTINDGTNNYYIYSKGNITYTGVGFNFGTLEEDEYKLFVNTMIAAYRSGVDASRPVILNSDKSSENNKDYLYVDYDATLKDDPNPIGDRTDVVPYDASGNIIPAGSDTPVSYYAKRVKYTLRNDSIVLNKQMTVHYYPCIQVGNVRVTLYDYPMELKTYWINTEVGQPDKEIKTMKTVESAFTYSVPDGVTQKATTINKKTGIPVSAGRGMVFSTYEYYVDIPISESYYKNLIWTSKGKTGTETISYSYQVGDNPTATLSIATGDFGLDKKNSFEVEIQVVMRYGRNPDKNKPLVGTRGVVFMRRGMFTLD